MGEIPKINIFKKKHRYFNLPIIESIFHSKTITYDIYVDLKLLEIWNVDCGML